MCKNTHTHAHTHAHSHTQTQTHTHTHTTQKCAHTHTHTHKRTCACACNRFSIRGNCRHMEARPKIATLLLACTLSLSHLLGAASFATVPYASPHIPATGNVVLRAVGMQRQSPRQGRCRAHCVRPAAGGLVMQTRKALCGLWLLQYTIEDAQHEVCVWLEEGGNMRPVTRNTTSHSEPAVGSVEMSAGRWSVTQSAVMLFHR